jgi:peptide/nickel transport system permease protein
MSQRLPYSRLLGMAATLVVMSFLVYMLLGLMPGDPVDMMLAGNPHMTPEDAARLKALYGLDQPLVLRYWRWLTTTLGGDAGYSRLYGVPVLQVLLPRLLNTFVLMGASLIMTVAAAVPLGVYAARHAGTRVDAAVNVFCLSGLSLPPFWLALLLIDFFVVKLGWLPASTTLDNPVSLILPVLTITIANLAVYIRHMRSSMIDALRADHIRTARAKGCSDARVTWNHAFRNALAPVVTILMLDLGSLLGGAVTIETIFAYPGMGKLMFDAVMGNDYNLALTGFLLLTAFVMLGNLLADAAYGFLDPRVRMGPTNGHE